MVGYDLSRYERHLALRGFSPETQERIRDSRVVVVGAGGLGSPVLLYLAAAGVGEIDIVDDDVVSVNNLQRQVIHDATSVQEPKVASAKNRLTALNHDVQVNAVGERLTAQRAPEIFDGATVVVDCCDNFSSRFLIDDVCERMGIPVVWGSISGFYGQVSVFPHLTKQDYGVTSGDDKPIGGMSATPNTEAKTPHTEAKLGRFPRLRTLFPEINLAGQECDGAAVPDPPEKTGTFGPLCGIVGSLMATEVLKVIGKIGEPLIGRVLLVDSLEARIREVSVDAEV